MLREFFELVGLQPPLLQGWMAVVAGVVGVVWVGVTWILVALAADEWRGWRNRRRRQREITDGAVRYLAQRQAQQRIRLVVDDERRKQLQQAAQTGRRD